jgi:dienelactone hydrolase
VSGLISFCLSLSLMAFFGMRPETASAATAKTAAPAAKVISKVHRYSGDNLAFEGLYFAAGKIGAPGIVVIPNWMGVTDEAEKQSIRLQKLGYNVLTADIYGAGVRPKNPQEAGALAAKYKVDRTLLRRRVHLALEELGRQAGVDPNRLAVVGYCFGGTAALEAGRNGENLRAIVTFHGGLDSPNPADGAKIKAKVLALHGAIDPFVPAKDVEAFENEMQKYKIDYELIKYANTVHSFTDMGAGEDLSKGAAYSAESDQKSFLRASEFLADSFK